MRIGTPPADAICPKLHPEAVKRREDWLDWVNQPLTIEERTAMEHCIARGCPFGEEKWQQRIAKKFGIDSTLRPRGRPRTAKPKK